MLVLSVILICFVPLCSMAPWPCPKDQIMKIANCIQNNKRHYLPMKIDGFEGEELVKKLWNYTCYANLKCFEGLEHCDISGYMADPRTCKNMEISMEPDFNECMEKLSLVTDNNCIQTFMHFFASTNLSKPKNPHLSCPIYKQFCARDYISENCAPGVMEKFQVVLNHVIRMKKCDQLL